MQDHFSSVVATRVDRKRDAPVANGKNAQCSPQHSAYQISQFLSDEMAPSHDLTISIYDIAGRHATNSKLFGRSGRPTARTSPSVERVGPLPFSEMLSWLL